MTLHVAVSGVQGAQADLNVIGNNIANANTTGFKQSRAEFADVYAASNLGIAKQTPGSGVRLARTGQQFTQGNISVTENSLDLAINGGGFFILDDHGTRLYSRAGNFGMDKDGYVVNADDKRLIVHQVNDNGQIGGELGPLHLSRQDLSPKATTQMNMGMNLNIPSTDKQIAASVTFDSTDPTTYNSTISHTIYDSLGAQHSASMYFRWTADNTWDVHTIVDKVDQGTNIVTFTGNGLIDKVDGVASPHSFKKSFTVTGGADPMVVNFDFTGTTQNQNPFSEFSLSQDGYSSGQLSGVDIDKRGLVYGRFSNGQSRLQGQVALAAFVNPQGLLQEGDTAWSETNQSGAPLIGDPGTTERGLLQSGALEEANVDLADQLVKLIVAQRNYQANTQVIRAEDTVNQAIINIR